MPLIAANPVLLGLTRQEVLFSPSQIEGAFEQQLARRRKLDLAGEIMLPRPTLEDAITIVADSKKRLAAVVELNGLAPNETIPLQQAEIREEVIAIVRAHLERFAY